MEKEPLDSLEQWDHQYLVYLQKKICNWDKKRCILTLLLFFSALFQQDCSKFFWSVSIKVVHSDQEGQGFFDVGEIDYQRQKSCRRKGVCHGRSSLCTLGQTGFFPAGSLASLINCNPLLFRSGLSLAIP